MATTLLAVYFNFLLYFRNHLYANRLAAVSYLHTHTHTHTLKSTRTPTVSVHSHAHRLSCSFDLPSKFVELLFSLYFYLRLSANDNNDDDEVSRYHCVCVCQHVCVDNLPRPAPTAHAPHNFTSKNTTQMPQHLPRFILTFWPEPSHVLRKRKSEISISIRVTICLASFCLYLCWMYHGEAGNSNGNGKRVRNRARQANKEQ